MGHTGFWAPKQEAAEVSAAAPIDEPQPIEPGLLFFLNLNCAFIQNFCDAQIFLVVGVGVKTLRVFLIKQPFTSFDWCFVHFRSLSFTLLFGIEAVGHQAKG